MTTNQAIDKGYELMHEWVTCRESGFDLDRIHASILQEHRWNLRTPCRATAANRSETFGKLILLGKVRKTLGEPRR